MTKVTLSELPQIAAHYMRQLGLQAGVSAPVPGRLTKLCAGARRFDAGLDLREGPIECYRNICADVPRPPFRPPSAVDQVDSTG